MIANGAVAELFNGVVWSW